MSLNFNVRLDDFQTISRPFISLVVSEMFHLLLPLWTPTPSTWQVTKTAQIVIAGMLRHGGGDVFKGFCYLREAQESELARPPRSL